MKNVKRFSISFVALTLISSYLFAQDIPISESVTAKNKEIIQNIREAEISSIEEGRYKKIIHEWYEPVSISHGVSSISINFEGDISFLSDFIVTQVTWNKFQRVSVGRYRDNSLYMRTKYTLWTPGVGIVLGKRPDSDNIRFGIVTNVYGFRIDNFALSLGFGWISEGKARFDTQNFFVSLPITFELVF